jgi:hypothetical protein
MATRFVYVVISVRRFTDREGVRTERTYLVESFTTRDDAKFAFNRAKRNTEKGTTATLWRMPREQFNSRAWDRTSFIQVAEQIGGRKVAAS